IECNLRDVVRAQRVFAETYYGLETPYPSGVRPSLFGAAAVIDFSLLKNGYIYREAKRSSVDLYPDEKTGVENIKH
ncbi:MAG: hypothetical protein LBH32_08215, partial [Dysgonamonadaceae bacterium]|nr:hypothetical protein [Dysgonamonadaceae bacterium]